MNMRKGLLLGLGSVAAVLAIGVVVDTARRADLNIEIAAASMMTIRTLVIDRAVSRP